MASWGVVSRKSEHEVAKSAASATTAYLIRFMIVSILRLEGHGDTQRVGHHERIVRSTFYIGFGIGIHLHAVDSQEIFDRVVATHLGDAQHSSDTLRKRVAQLDILETEVASVVEPEGAHDTTPVTHRLFAFYDARHLRIALVVSPRVAPDSRGVRVVTLEVTIDFRTEHTLCSSITCKDSLEVEVAPTEVEHQTEVPLGLCSAVISAVVFSDFAITIGVLINQVTSMEFITTEASSHQTQEKS